MSTLKSCLIKTYRYATWPWRQIAMSQLKRQQAVPVAVLFYHRVANEHPNPWSISEKDFEKQIDWMQKNFDLISLEETQKRIRTGSSRPSLSITFDDGYAENCSFALPMLIERKIPVTYFVTTYHTTHNQPFPHDVELGQPLPTNTIDSLRALANAGVEIGGHTRNHADLGAGLSDEELFDEVISATLELEKMIGCPIRYFAFPYGLRKNLDPRVFKLLQDNGFSGVCSAYGGVNEINGDDFHIQRIHGDPNFERMLNWLSIDPRMTYVNRYDWQAELSKLEAKQAGAAEQLVETTEE